MRFQVGCRILVLGTMVFSPVASSAHEILAGTLKIEHPWVAAAEADRSTSTGYVIEIENTGSEPERLLGATLDGADPGRIEARAESGAGFQPLAEGVIIPAGGRIEMDPSRTQVVFRGLKRPLIEGKVAAGALRFQHAGTVPVTFHIESRELLGSESATAETHGHSMAGMSMPSTRRSFRHGKAASA